MSSICEGRVAIVTGLAEASVQPMPARWPQRVPKCWSTISIPKRLQLSWPRLWPQAAKRWLINPTLRITRARGRR